MILNNKKIKLVDFFSLELFFKLLYPVSFLVKRGSNFLINLFFARVLSVNEFGLYSYISNIVNYVLISTNFGYNDYAIVKASNDEKKFIILLRTGLITSILTLGIIYFASAFFFIENLKVYSLIIIKNYLGFQFPLLLLAYFQFKNKFSTIAVINIITAILLLFSTFFSLYFGAGFENILLGIDLLLVLSILVQMVFIVNSQKVFASVQINNLWDGFRQFDKDIVFFGINSIITPLYMQLPLFFFSFRGEKHEIAILNFSYMIANTILLIAVAQTTKLLPRIIGKEKWIIKRFILKETIRLTSLNLLFFVMFYFFGKDLILLVTKKNEFLASYNVLLILLIANIFQAISGVLVSVLTSLNLQKLKISIQLRLIFVSLILLYVLVYNLNLNYIGVAICYLSMYFLGFVLYLKRIRKILSY